MQVYDIKMTHFVPVYLICIKILELVSAEIRVLALMTFFKSYYY